MLPGTDDGAHDMDEAIGMCEACLEDGVTAVACTPHHLNGAYLNNRTTVRQKVEELQGALEKRGLPLTLIPGSDITMCPELPGLLDKKDVMTIADQGVYILLEPQLFFMPEALNNMVFELKRRGITPIITHPERYALIASRTGILIDAIFAGALVQVTAGSITGAFGRETKTTALGLIKAGVVHFIASDAHNMSSRRPGLSEARKVIADISGPDEASRMFEHRPEAVIKGETITAPEPHDINKPPRKGILSKLFPWVSG